MKKILSKSVLQTEKIANSLAKSLKGNEIISLYGDLGAGKTSFTKGLSKALNVNPDEVHSPTFTLLNEYNGKYKRYHFDMYKINSFEELYSIGFFDFIENGIIITEWSENIDKFLPESAIKIHIEYGQNENERILKFENCEVDFNENISCKCRF